MDQHPPQDDVPEDRRKQIYQELVEAQDLQELTPGQARHLVAGRFGITEARLRQIEDEARERLW